MKANHSIQALCENLDVASSTYYHWVQRQESPGPRALQNQALSKVILAIHAQSRQTYGSPRVVAELRNRGESCGRNRVTRLMKQQGLCGRQKRRYCVQTTDSNHDHPIAPNRLADAPEAVKPNQIWVSDITYVDTQEGWLYLAGILDLYSRKVVGWAMSDRINTPLVMDALTMALLHRGHPTQLLLHSDRGVQYASAPYRAAVARAGLIPSMSRRGNCYDNATMESFWSSLKLELVYRCKFLTRAQAKTAIFDYIETFYNRERSHSSLGFLSPTAFESKNN